MNAIEIASIIAWRFAHNHRDIEDITQEAAIDVAKVMGEKPDASRAYLMGVAQNRVLDILSGRRYTSIYVGKPGHPVDPMRRTNLAYLDSLSPIEEESNHAPVVQGWEDDVEWSYFRPEIDAAIDELPETQARVSRLFMHGYNASEAARKLRLTSSAGRQSWSNARRELATSLAHLEPLVRAA